MNAPSQESRQFRMHPDLLFSVIRAQAGTLAKAILELVMNSIDAGATRVDIQLDRHTFSISDDGRGFTCQTEIDDFFETFGTPHVDGDATYGKFRMGRGQIMAFSVNKWRSGPFRMLVDIQSKGLDYLLEKNLPAADGCVISGQLYDVLTPSEVINTEQTLKEQCRYTPAPIYLNGKLLTEDASTQKWTVVNEDAYIRADTSRQLSVYNLGVLVAHFSGKEFGVGGVVVSRQQLDLNFARNDILRNKCLVWKRLRPVLTKLSGEINGKEPAQKRTDDWREFQSKAVWSLHEQTADECAEFEKLPLFTDISGQHLSFAALVRQALQRAIVIAPSKSLQADKVHQAKLACVLTGETFTRRFGCTIEDILDHLDAVPALAPGQGRHSSLRYFEDSVESIRKALGNFEEVAKTVNSEHHIIPANKVPKEVACALRALAAVQHSILRCLPRDEHYWLDRDNIRAILTMESDTADAFTDGQRNIFISIKFLRGADGPNNGAAWAAQMVCLLLHEYGHDLDSGEGHIHDADFYANYHDATTSVYFGPAVKYLMLEWATRSKSDLGKTNKRLLHQIDVQARGSDRIESMQEAA